MPDALDPLLAWMREHPRLLQGLSVLGVLSFVASLVLVPRILARLPADHFVRVRAVAPSDRRRVRWWVLRGLRNLLGLVLLLGGIAMLVLPGQGLLTILIALVLLDLPGKRWLERALLRRGAFLRAVNWLRQRSGVPDLLPPPEADPPSAPE